MNDDMHTITSGFLEVGDGHKLYYQQWGNKQAAPIFYLHGGPGSSCKDKVKAFFDPKKHNVIFHDQRGGGQSTPSASTEHNTTQKLVSDIEKLREMFGFETVSIIGGSWGSTLALVYAETHPNRVVKMLLWGIYTGTKEETDYIQQGGLNTHFPESWEQYIEVVPENMRDKTTEYYMDIFKNCKDQNKVTDHVRRWVLNESAAMSIDGDFMEAMITTDGSDETTKALAILEAHYFINDCFLEPDAILKNAENISGIPIVLVQGRFDHVTPPTTAYSLSKALGKNCHLHIVPSSHGKEGALRETLKAYAWSFLA